VMGVVGRLGQRMRLYEIEPLVAALLDAANFPFFIEDFLEDRGNLFIHQTDTFTSTNARLWTTFGRMNTTGPPRTFGGSMAFST